MSAEATSCDATSAPSPVLRRIYTIGHSDHEIDRFLSLLRDAGIEAIADTRSQPYSRRAPQFDREALRRSLAAVGIRYAFLGDELGGRPRERDFYDPAGHVLYDRVAESDRFARGIARLEEGISRYRAALLCAEESPRDCHRRLLVARVLIDRGIEVIHLRASGRAESEMELRAGDAQSRLRGQGLMFDAMPEKPWRSTRSVSPRSPQSSSSEPSAVPESASS